jgi:putative DNA primase/helicase
MQFPVSVYTPKTTASSVIALRNYRKDVELVKVLDAVRAGTYAEIVEAFRNTQDTNDKYRLPGFTASGVYQPTHAAANFKTHNGLFSIDIDNLEDSTAAEHFRDLAESQSFAVAGFVSPSGRGVKLFVAVDLPFEPTDTELLEWHRHMWPVVSAFVCSVLGVPAVHQDTTSINPNRMCFMSSDAGAFFNDDPVPLVVDELPPIERTANIAFEDKPETEDSTIRNFRIAEPEPIEPPAGTDAPRTDSRFTYAQAFEFVCNKIRNDKNRPADFTPGTRHDFAVRVAHMLNRQGVPEGEAAKLFKAHFAGASDNINHHLQTFRTVYFTQAAEHGSFLPVEKAKARATDRARAALESESKPTNGSNGKHADDADTPEVHPISKAALGDLTRRLELSDIASPPKPPRNGKNCIDPSTPENRRILRALNENEVGDRDLLSAEFDGDRIYDHTNKRWMIYNAPAWEADNTKRTHKDLQAWLVKQYEPLKYHFHEIAKETKSEDAEEMYKRLHARVWQLNGKKRMDNVLELLASELATTAEMFDAHPMLFAFKETVMNLETGALEPVSPELLLTKTAAYSYDAEAECPKFQSFLDDILPIPEVQQFVQRFIGICLTGKIMAQGMLFAYGHGKNGKSTFFAIINMLLGKYQVQMQTERFMGKMPNGNNSADYYTVRLKGARLAVGTEIPTSFEFDEAQIKVLTGGDVISAREIYSQVVVFEPTHKLALFGNHKPKIKGADEGIWRRMWLVPFTTTIPESKRRSQDEIMADMTAELPGIWNWAYEGLQAVQRDGWKVPAAIMDATADYKSDTDPLDDFIKANITPKEGSQIYITELFIAYKQWCEKEQIPPVFFSAKTFRIEFENRKYAITPPDRNNRRYLFGYRFATDTDRIEDQSGPIPTNPIKAETPEPRPQTQPNIRPLTDAPPRSNRPDIDFSSTDIEDPF